MIDFAGILEERGGKLQDLIAVTLYIRDMNDYGKYNSEYIQFFASKPPVRICVQAPLPCHMGVLLEALAYLPLVPTNSNSSACGGESSGSDCGDSTNNISNRQCMHVQGISHWAPANIGPYSQAVWVSSTYTVTTVR